MTQAAIPLKNFWAILTFISTLYQLQYQEKTHELNHELNKYNFDHVLPFLSLTLTILICPIFKLREPPTPLCFSFSPEPISPPHC